MILKLDYKLLMKIQIIKHLQILILKNYFFNSSIFSKVKPYIIKSIVATILVIIRYQLPVNLFLYHYYTDCYNNF